MSEYGIVHLIGLIGFLILAVSGYRSFRIGGRKTVGMVLIWLAIFVGAALLFSAIA